jgi:hypothetical protein
VSSFLLVPPHQQPACTSPVFHTCYMATSSHYYWSDLPNNIWWAKIMQFSLCSFLRFQVTHETHNAKESRGTIMFKHHRAWTATLATYHRRSAYIPCNKLYLYSRQENTSCFHFLSQLVLCTFCSPQTNELIGMSTNICSTKVFNLLKPTGHVMHQQLNIQQLYALPTLYLCVLYITENKQRLVPLTS